MSARWTHAWAAEGALASLRLVFALWLLAFSIGTASHEHETAEHAGHASVCILCSMPGDDEGDDLHPAASQHRLAAPQGEAGAASFASVSRFIETGRIEHPVRGPPLSS